jgi:phage replication O-like protein O
MADVQLQKGYAKIANELSEQVARQRLSGNESSVWVTLERAIYGWDSKTKNISLSYFQNITKLDRSSVCRALNKLIMRNMVVKELISGKNGNGHRASSYTIQKDYDKWLPIEKPKKTKKISMRKEELEDEWKGYARLKRYLPTLEDPIAIELDFTKLTAKEVERAHLTILGKILGDYKTPNSDQKHYYEELLPYLIEHKLDPLIYFGVLVIDNKMRKELGSVDGYIATEPLIICSEGAIRRYKHCLTEIAALDLYSHVAYYFQKTQEDVVLKALIEGEIIIESIQANRYLNRLDAIMFCVEFDVVPDLYVFACREFKSVPYCEEMIKLRPRLNNLINRPPDDVSANRLKDTIHEISEKFYASRVVKVVPEPQPQAEQTEPPKRTYGIDAEDILSHFDSEGNKIVRRKGERPMSEAEILAFMDAGLSCQEIMEIDIQATYEIAENTQSELQKLITRVQKNPAIVESL